MLFAAVLALCIILLILAFVLPRLSPGPQRAVDSGFGAGARGAGKGPGPLGRWFAKPFRSSREATNRSAEAGRSGRSKLPF